MPPVTDVGTLGPVGFLLPPMPARGRGAAQIRTDGSTKFRTFGSTTWVIAAAGDAESAGAGGVWASDHLFWRRPAGECMTTLAAAATAARRAVLGTCVLQLPLRQPTVVAKQAAALQALSGGRFVLGVGVGSHRGEYEAAGVPFAGRGRALDAGIADIRRSWSDAPAEEAAGDGYRLTPSLPAPIWVGGSSAAARRRAATTADGWVPLFLDPPSFGAGLKEVHELAAAAGRDPHAVVPSVVAVVSPGPDMGRAARDGLAWLADLYGLPPKAFARHLIAGPAEHCAEAIARYHDAGAVHVVLMVAGDDALEGFASIASLMGQTGRREPSPAIEMAGVGA